MNMRDAAYLVVVRLIIIPAILVAILKLLPLDARTYNVAMIVAVMPASCASVLVAKKYGACSDFAGQIIVFTTCLAPFTVPLMLYFLK